MWLRLTDPTVVELVGGVGFDWVMFDAEHAAFAFQTLQTQLRRTFAVLWRAQAKVNSEEGTCCGRRLHRRDERDI
ncbi:MAG TPA: hypothetical protein EYP04_07095 [Anaerolineae bacterium]|nr:hypothetical protein [Anaerolineae bacterium]